MAVRRFDAGSTGRVEVTPQGGLRIPAVPTRVGVFPYTGESGKTRLEYRPPDEVFHPDSLATLRAAPVTDLHPAEPVTAATWRALAVGHVADTVTPDLTKGEVGTNLVIQDQEMVQKVGAGERRDLSCGYSCDLELSPGSTPQGQRYDAIQRRIRYNHVALGPPGWGRQGPDSSIRLDSGDAFQTESIVEKEKIDGVEYTVGTPEHLAALRKSREVAMGRADAAESKAKTPVVVPPPPVDPKAVHQVAQIRADLLVQCHQVAALKGRKFDAAGAAAASNDQIIAELIGMIDPNFETQGKTPDYLAGALTMMIRGLSGAAEMGGGSTPEAPPAADATPAAPPAAKTDSKGSIFGARAGTEETKVVSKGGPDDHFDSDKARNDMLSNSRARWQRPLAMSKDTPAK